MALQSARALRARLRAGETLVGDGAMGTELIRRGLRPEATLAANSRTPEIVSEIHQAYLEAGAGILTCNTFGATSVIDGHEDIEAGVALGLAVARSFPRAVAAWISLPPDVLIRDPIFVRFLASRFTAWPSCLLIETAASQHEAVAAAEMVRDWKPELLAVTAHFRSDGRMPDGTPPEQAAIAFILAGADIVGANCGEAPETYVEVAARMRSVTDRPLLFQPSAGLPVQSEDGAWFYPVTSAAFAAIAKRLFDSGASIVGGCCGTSPDYIRAVDSLHGTIS